jgi:CheY-like chemotaxis protein
MTTILVADDEPILLRVLVEALTDEGYEVLAARDGREAMEIARAQSPDLVLMDIMMPRLDGREAAKRLREDARLRNTPIVLMSAGRVIARSDDGIAFLAKPFDLDRLLSLIARLLTHANDGIAATDCR